MILQAIYEQLLCGYDVQKLGKYSFYIPSQNLYIEAKTDKQGNVKHLSLTFHNNFEKEKENEKRKR